MTKKAQNKKPQPKTINNKKYQKPRVTFEATTP